MDAGGGKIQLSENSLSATRLRSTRDELVCSKLRSLPIDTRFQFALAMPFQSSKCDGIGDLPQRTPTRKASHLNIATPNRPKPRVRR